MHKPFFKMVFRMVQKENVIIFLVASETVNEGAWNEMHI